MPCGASDDTSDLHVFPFLSALHTGSLFRPGQTKISGAFGAEMSHMPSGTLYERLSRSGAFAEKFCEDDKCLARESRAENRRLAFCFLGTS